MLQDGLRDDVQRVHLDGTRALFDACVRAGVNRVIHLSAIGAEPDGPTAFSRSKAKAEVYLKDFRLDWMILRPALVLGPAVYGGTAMLRGIAAFPGICRWCAPTGASRSSDSTIYGDRRVRARATAQARRSGRLRTRKCSASPISWPRSVSGSAFHRRVLRCRTRSLAVAAFADGLGCLGWRSPARSTSLAQLTAGVVGDPAAGWLRPASRPGLDHILAVRPASVQDRWFARLYLLKPLAILGLALAVIVPSAEQLAAVLGLRPNIARPMLPVRPGVSLCFWRDGSSCPPRGALRSDRAIGRSTRADRGPHHVAVD